MYFSVGACLIKKGFRGTSCDNYKVLGKEDCSDECLGAEKKRYEKVTT